MFKIPDKCLVCGKELSMNDYFLFPIERPYCNLFVHKTCTQVLRNMELTEDLVRKMCKGDFILKEEGSEKG